MRIALSLTAAAVLSLGLAGCAKSLQWSGPGWYLNMPHQTIAGADYYAGPLSYDDCEEARKKETVANKMLCSYIVTKPAD
jgi:hypothetical protein